MGKTIRINGIDVPVIEDRLTGRDIRALAQIDEDRVLVRQDPEQNTIIPDTTTVRIAGDEVFTDHARHSKASPTKGVTVRRRYR